MNAVLSITECASRNDAIQMARAQALAGRLPGETCPKRLWPIERGERVVVGSRMLGVEFVDDENGLVVVSDPHAAPSGRAVNYRGTIYEAWPWWHCLPASGPVYEDLSQDRSDVIFSSKVALKLLVDISCRGVLADDPGCQKDVLWSPEDAEAYLESVLIGRGLGEFLVGRDAAGHQSLIDGKQRMKAIRDFVLGVSAYRGRAYYELTPRDRAVMGARQVEMVKLDISNMPRSEVLEHYLRANPPVPATNGMDLLTGVRKRLEQSLRDEDRTLTMRP